MRGLSLTTLALGWLTACGPGIGDATPGPDELADGRTLVHAFDNRYEPPPRVDIIRVIDDSPSMRTFQPDWAANLEPLAAIIDAPDVEADVRIAITTTSVPGPTCSGARALGGAGPRRRRRSTNQRHLRPRRARM